MLANILILLAPIAYSINDSFNYTKGGADWEGNCKSGPIQSPINIRYSRAILPAPGLGEISTNFLNTTLSGNFSDRGLGIKGNFGNISFYEYGYYLESAIKKVYFFAPAQHYLNNRKYSLEVTILMEDTFDGYYGVALSILFRTGSSNPFFDSLISYLGKFTNPSVNLTGLIPETIQNFYAYEGSLPVPPCNETMRWYIYPSVQTLSSTQLSFFSSHWAGNNTFASGRGNNRLIQSLNSRDVLYHRSV